MSEKGDWGVEGNSESRKHFCQPLRVENKQRSGERSKLEEAPKQKAKKGEKTRKKEKNRPKKKERR